MSAQTQILPGDCLAKLGLTQQPFLPQWQDAFAYADPALDMSINVALEHLRDQSPPVLIKGEYGIGKSAQLQKLMLKAGDLHFCRIDAGPETSMAAVDYAVRLQWQPHPRHGDPKQLSLDRYLAALCEDGMRPVLAVDDAHHLEPKVLGTLLNLKQHMKNKLGQTLGLLLTGERGIDRTLALLEPKLRIVSSIYAVMARPLNREQTANYIGARLRAAGLDGELPLDATAIDRIQQESGGLPGTINPAATRALEAQCTKKAGKGRGAPRLNLARSGRYLMPATVGLVVLGLLAALYGLISGLLSSDAPTEVVMELPPPSPPAAPPQPTATAADEADKLPRIELPPTSEAPEQPEPLVSAEPPSPDEAVPKWGESLLAELEQPEAEPVATAEPAPTTTPVVPAAQPKTSPPTPPTPAAPPARPTATTPPAPPPPRVDASLPQGQLHDALWFMRQDADGYTIQVLGASSADAVTGFYGRHASGLEAAWARTLRNGQAWFVLVIGVFPGADEARLAIEALPASIQANRPFVRRVGNLQEAIIEAR